MCRESFITVQQTIGNRVGQEGGLWATTRRELREFLLQEDPSLQDRAALEHPLVGLARGCDIGSALLTNDCCEVVILYDLLGPWGNSSLAELRRASEERGLSASVKQALMESESEVMVSA